MKIKQKAAPSASPSAPSGLQPTEYALTPDEKGMLDQMAAAHQAAYEAERNMVLASIIRFRNLGGGAWHLDSASGKLTRQ